TGMAALSHYVLGASQQGLAAYQAPLFGVRAELAALLEEKSDSTIARESASRLIENLLAFHAQGEVAFSFAKEGFGEAEVAHPAFGSRVHAANPDARHILALLPRHAEQALWKLPDLVGGAALTARQKERFKEGFGKDNAHLRFPLKKYSNPDPIHVHVAAKFLSAAGCIEEPEPESRDGNSAVWPIFNPHSLKEISECPFKWFSRRIGLEDSADLDDSNMVIGEFLHRLYRAVVERLHELQAVDSASFDAAFDRVLRPVSESLYREKGPGIRPLLRAFIRKARHRLYTLWQFEQTLCAGYTRSGFEVKLRHRFDAAHAYLQGRADCVFHRIDPATRQNAYIILDYKKNNIPNPSDMKTNPKSAEYDVTQSPMPVIPAISEIQVPAYALLMEKNGGRVEGAVYWSIEKAEGVAYIKPQAAPESFRLSSVFNNEAEASEVRAELHAILARAAVAVAECRLLSPTILRRFCEDCKAKPLCRFWYFMELP
ncbi:MAG: PD-(D/E)XK nuclease family protein, partial [Rectinema sp.]|nr:PD-(D/E)XK nuclease family protein [Rectinema sp.]